MRGADGGPQSHVLALPALWVGVLYDHESKAAALDLTRDWTLAEIETLREDVRGPHRVTTVHTTCWRAAWHLHGPHSEPPEHMLAAGACA